jgi:Heat induced stress protein YflT
MATNSPDTNLETSNERVVAFFRVQQDAFRAISELKEAGFTSSEIGLMSKGKVSATDVVGEPTTADAAMEQVNLGGDHLDGDHSESMWEKLKHFFGGDSSEDADYRESAAGMRWDERRGDRYYRGLEQGGAVVTVAGPRVQEAREILQDAGADLQEQEEEFESVEQNFSDRGEGLDSAGDDIEEIDGEGLDAEDIEPEAARRDRDYRIQLHGEAFRSFRNRLDSQGGEVGTQSFQEEPRLDELETSDDTILEDNRNKLRKPAA